MYPSCHSPVYYHLGPLFAGLASHPSVIFFSNPLAHCGTWSWRFGPAYVRYLGYLETEEAKQWPTDRCSSRRYRVLHACHDLHFRLLSFPLFFLVLFEPSHSLRASKKKHLARRSSNSVPRTCGATWCSQSMAFRKILFLRSLLDVFMPLLHSSHC